MSRLLRVAAVCFAVAAVAVLAHDTGVPPPDFDWEDKAALERAKAEHNAAAAGLEMLRVRHEGVRAQVRATASNKSCAVCQEVGDIALRLLANATDKAAAEKAIAAVCKDVFKKNGLDALVCAVLPDVIITAAEMLKDRLRFNVPNIVCADVLHACTQPCCDVSAPHRPEQIHLSIANVYGNAADNMAMRASWTTLKPTGTGPNETRVCWRQVGAANFSCSEGAESRTYTLGGWEGMLYSAVMYPLSTDYEGEYEYFVGDAALGVSELFNFTSLYTSIATEGRALRVVAIADMGFGANAQPTIDRLKAMVAAKEVDLIVHGGDIGYADGDQVWWDVFMREMQPIMARVPYMTVPGNHECAFWNCTAYRHRFWMPPATLDPQASNLTVPSDALFYKQCMASVCFYMINSESAFDTPEVNDLQLAWLAAALDEDWGEEKMRVAVMHRPMYCDPKTKSHEDCIKSAAYLRGRLEELFHKYSVDVVMCGHLHNYQRTLPVYQGRVVAPANDTYDLTAPVYIVNGGAGNREGNHIAPGAPQPWAAFTTTERTFMKWEFATAVLSEGRLASFSGTTIRSTTGEVVDSVSLTRIYD